MKRVVVMKEVVAMKTFVTKQVAMKTFVTKQVAMKTFVTKQVAMKTFVTKRVVMKQVFNISNVSAGDGRKGYPDDAPYNAIHVGAAAAILPEPVTSNN
jgi:hypothetical protein